MFKYSPRWFTFSSFFWMLGNLPAQHFSIHFQPVFYEKNIVLNAPFFDQNGDSLAFHTLRFYVGNIVFLKNGTPVFEERKYHLLDLENEKSLDMAFQFPKKMDFDSLQFDLGVDSLTHVLGAMGGDLDPTRGMFWTWQSGYINFKMEGFHEKCSAQKHEFEFHLGGFLSPFQTVQKVVLPVFSIGKIWVNLELAPFFEKINWAKKQNVMSPSAEAVRFSEILSKSFFVDEK
jgi:hypothetical protein